MRRCSPKWPAPVSRSTPCSRSRALSPAQSRTQRTPSVRTDADRPSKFPGEPNTALLASPVGPTSPKDEVGDVEAYDIIIVGGGTAGCVLATRLSEDPNTSVLVIEAGHSDLRQLMSRVPAGFAQLFGKLADWNYNTSPQEHVDGRQLYQPRGKMLGGCRCARYRCALD